MRLERIVASLLTCVILGSCAGEAPEGEAPQGAAASLAETIGQTVAAAEALAVGRRVVVEGGQYTDVMVPELQAMLTDKDFPLINVHVPFAGDILGTDFSFPWDEIANNLDRLPADKSAPIVLYCRTGPMSASAAEELAGLGYTNVYNLVGGFNAWVEAGLPMVAQ